MIKQHLNAFWLALTNLGWSLNMNAQGYSGGAGTEASPYEIANKSDLKNLCEHSSDWDKHFNKLVILFTKLPLLMEAFPKCINAAIRTSTIP